MNPRMLFAAAALVAFGPACRRSPNPPAGAGQGANVQAPQAATVVVYKSPT